MASGVLDMVGNIYQWTDEVCDDHTCRGIVRGGNNYYPRGSQWCKPQTIASTKTILSSGLASLLGSFLVFLLSSWPE